MTREEFEAKWQGMTPRERDAWVAEDVMGYELRGFTHQSINLEYWYDDKGMVCRRNGFTPSEDILSAMEVEEKIKELNLERKYSLQLEKLMHFIYGSGKVTMFDLIHATPYQRCKAALMAKVVE